MCLGGSKALVDPAKTRIGRFLIVNIMSVDGRPLRDGARRDEELLAEAWTKLGFEVGRLGFS